MKRITFIVALGLLASSNASAASAGRAVIVRGDATVQRAGTNKQDAVELQTGDRLEQGDRIATGAESRVRLLMKDKSILDLGESTTLTLQSYAVSKKQRKVGMRLWLGRVWAKVRSWGGSDSAFEVETDNAVAGVRGTELVITPDSVWVVEGSAWIRVGGEQTDLGDLQVGRVSGGAVVLENVTPEQIQQVLANLHPRNQLTNDGMTRRVPGQTGDDDGAPPLDDRIDDFQPDLTVPPVDLDPAPERTIVEGRVVIEE